MASRRGFLTQSARFLGGGWAALQLPAIAALAACARDAARRGEAFTTLSDAEAATLAAVAEQILPSDELPGAREAGVIHFMDRALGSYFQGMLEPIRAGVADLDARAHDAGAVVGFASLAPERQRELLLAVEETPFFFLARMLSVMGTFTLPAHGGNRDGVGWRLLQIDHQPAYKPPFGWYDAEYAAKTAGGDA